MNWALFWDLAIVIALKIMSGVSFESEMPLIAVENLLKS
jgi:hypothetical protein